MSDLIFVYGTLLRTVPSAASNSLKQYARFVGEAVFPGVLYDLGSYPGFAPGPATPGLVKGEIYELHEPKEAFIYLDRYEGLDEQTPLYRREKLTHPDHGQVWTYIYQGETTGLPLIPGGDYRNYYEQQARHLMFIQRGE